MTGNLYGIPSPILSFGCQIPPNSVGSIVQNVPEIQWFMNVCSTYRPWLSEQEPKGSEDRFLPDECVHNPWPTLWRRHRARCGCQNPESREFLGPHAHMVGQIRRRTHRILYDFHEPLDILQALQRRG